MCIRDRAPTAPSVTLAPIYSSALGNLTSGLATGALTSLVPSASVNPIISSILANLTSALPETAQPTGAVPTALPSTYANGTGVQPVEPHHGMSLQDILDWIAYLLAHTFTDIQEDEGNSKRSHARDLGMN